MTFLKFCLRALLFGALAPYLVADPNTPAQDLGWISTTGTLSCNACGGYYDPSIFPEMSPVSFADSEVKIDAKPPVNYKLNGNVEFGNGVTITQPGRSLSADQATLTPNLKTGKLDALAATGNIRLAQPGELLLAQSMQANLVDHQASAVDVNYLIRVGETSPSLTNTPTTDPNFTGFAHGSASTVTQNSEKTFSLADATYSTCSPLSHTWELDANSIDIDQNTGTGIAYNTVLKFHNIPLLYLPYFTFPTSNARKSGFLYGNLYSSSQSGLVLTLPYYFNLAPNYDDTLTPSLYTTRGILFDNNFRYLTSHHSGNLDISFIPYDQGDNNQWRYSYSLNDNSTYGPWSTAVNYNAVSDDAFLQDFSVFNANQVLLNQSLNTTYQNTHWIVTGTLQTYQIVNSELTTQNTPYNQLPEINATGEYPNSLGPFSFSLDANLANFTKSTTAPFEVVPVQGVRLNLTPMLSLPLAESYGYITPNVSFYNTDYSISNANANGLPSSTPSINVPIVNVDSSLYFDRDFSFAGQNYSQNLSPRLYYLYVPYQNQSAVPIFDTTIVPFSFSQLFTNNSFSGYDRIQNANQLSYALTSYVNDASGDQVLSGGLGQIWYFASRDVTLCQNQPGAPPCIQTENSNYNQPFSDAAAYFNYNFNTSWGFSTNLTYNPNTNLVDSQEYTLSYTPSNMNVFNISYQNNLQNYSLLSNQQLLAGTPPPSSSILNASFVWGLTPQWAVFGSASYSLEDSGPIDQFGGIQYSSCCWAVRLGDYRYVVNNNPNTPNVLTGQMTNTFLLQVLLKGLGGVSSGAVDSLLASIPTYHGQLGF